MKGKRIAGILGISLGISMLASGCAETPESSIVKQKGKSAMENYKEAGDGTESSQTAEAAESTEQDGKGTEAADQSTEGAQTSSGLREAVGAPERYQSEVEDTTGKLKIFTDAQVEIPAADKVSTIAVTQHPFDQELIDRVTETFFPDADVYEEYSYTQWTKADWQAKLEELKGYAAEGNLDPYNYGTDEEGNYFYDLNQSIETVEQNYQNAPEERTPKKVTPQFGLEVDYGNGSIEKQDDYFFGIVEMGDQGLYSYRLKKWGSMPMEIDIAKLPDEDSGYDALRWIEYQALQGADSGGPDEETVKADIGISLEEARRIGDEKVAKLNIPNMEVVSWEYGLQFGETYGDVQDVGGYARERQTNAGYILHYARKLGGVPVTYTMDFGGNLESMESEMETWGYERLDLYVTKDGIDSMTFINLYDIGETKTERLELMPFQEIMNIYEKMMLIQNADIINYENDRTYRINRITLGYSRIYEPSTDSRSGLLVPVWDFFGEFESHWEGDGESYDNLNTTQYQSYLTINAVDGSVIDRGLGY